LTSVPSRRYRSAPGAVNDVRTVVNVVRALATPEERPVESVRRASMPSEA
jgi:hypothetical protein